MDASLPFDGIIIGKRHNFADGISNSEAFERHDRQIGETLYRFVKHWPYGRVRKVGNVGIIVYRVTLGDHGEDIVTLLRTIGQPMPERRW
jgi:hypothetical protein